MSTSVKCDKCKVPVGANCAQVYVDSARGKRVGSRPGKYSHYTADLCMDCYKVILKVIKNLVNLKKETWGNL